MRFVLFIGRADVRYFVYWCILLVPFLYFLHAKEISLQNSINLPRCGNCRHPTNLMPTKYIFRQSQGNREKKSQAYTHARHSNDWGLRPSHILPKYIQTHTHNTIGIIRRLFRLIFLILFSFFLNRIDFNPEIRSNSKPNKIERKSFYLYLI